MAIINTNSLTSVPGGGADEANRGLSSTYGQIAQQAVQIGLNFQQARKNRGIRQAKEDFAKAAANTPAGSPVIENERQNEFLDFMGIREKSYANTLQYLTISRAKEDAKEEFNHIAKEAEALPSEYQKKTEAFISSYVAGLNIEDRKLVEREFRAMAASGYRTAVLQRRKADKKEARQSVIQEVSDLQDELSDILRDGGADAANSDEYKKKLQDYIDLQDMRQGNPDFIYSEATRNADDLAFQKRLVAGVFSNTVAQTYEKQGKTAAIAMAETIITNAETLSSADKEALRVSLNKEIKNLSLLDDALQAEVVASRKKINNARAAELKIKVSRGTAKHSDIEAARDWLTPAKYAELTIQRDKYVEKQRKNAGASLYASAVVSGQIKFDPTNTKQRKILDRNFEQEIVPKLASSPDPEGDVMEYIRETGHLPKIIKSQIAGQVMNGTPEQQVAAVTNAGNLKTEMPHIYEELPSKVRDITNYASSRIAAGVDPASAILGAREAIFVDDATRDARAKTLTKKRLESAVATGLKIAKVKENYNLYGTRDEYIRDYELIYRDEYIKVGETVDDETIHENVISQLDSMWGVSRISGDKQIMKLPPEKVYVVPGMSEKKSSAWMREQLRIAVSDALGGPPTKSRQDKHDFVGQGFGKIQANNQRLHESAKSAFLVSDVLTRKAKDKQNTSWQVWFKNKDGIAEPLIINGKPMRWKPVWRSSPEFARQQRLQAKHAEKIKKKFDKAEARHRRILRDKMDAETQRRLDTAKWEQEWSKALASQDTALIGDIESYLSDGE